MAMFGHFSAEFKQETLIQFGIFIRKALNNSFRYFG